MSGPLLRKLLRNGQRMNQANVRSRFHPKAVTLIAVAAYVPKTFYSFNFGMHI